MKIVFVHNMAMHYRIPFFSRLAEQYDVDFLFTHVKKVEGLNGINYEILHNYFGVATGLILRLLKKDSDIIIVGGWDSLPELIEVIICFGSAKLRRRPFILYYGGWDHGAESIKRKMINPLVKCIINHSDAIVTYGTKSKEYSTKLGATPDKVFIAFNTSIIDKSVRQEEVEDLRRCLGIENKRVILYVGRLVKRKNADILIKSFYKLKEEQNDVCLIIIGDGECKAKFQSLCREMNIENKVLFLGTIKNKDLPLYYSLCDLFVLPASREPWGLVLNEAMQFGKPVIATCGVGAAYDLINDGENGFMVPERDVDALHEAMKKILSDPGLEGGMGVTSKMIIESFTYEHMVEGFRKAIKSVRTAKKDPLGKEL